MYRSIEQKKLIEKATFYVKSKERKELRILPYVPIIITDKYIVVGAKIFYL